MRCVKFSAELELRFEPFVDFENAETKIDEIIHAHFKDTVDDYDYDLDVIIENDEIIEYVVTVYAYYIAQYKYYPATYWEPSEIECDDYPYWEGFACDEYQLTVLSEKEDWEYDCCDTYWD